MSYGEGSCGNPPPATGLDADASVASSSSYFHQNWCDAERQIRELKAKLAGANDQLKAEEAARARKTKRIERLENLLGLAHATVVRLEAELDSLRNGPPCGTPHHDAPWIPAALCSECKETA